MPLMKGKSQGIISKNIEELLHAYKKTGKIGNTRPRSVAHARRIAAKIAYELARGR